MINCPDCGALVSERAVACPKCGAPMTPTVPPQTPPASTPQPVTPQPVTPQPATPYTVAPQKESNTSSVYLLIFLVVKIFQNFTQTLITKLNYSWYYSITWYIYWVIDLLAVFAIFLPAIAIKDKNLKTIGIIISSTLAIWWAISDVLTMFRVW